MLALTASAMRIKAQPTQADGCAGRRPVANSERLPPRVPPAARVLVRWESRARAGALPAYLPNCLPTRLPAMCQTLYSGTGLQRASCLPTRNLFVNRGTMILHRFIIERTIPEVGTFE